MVNKKTIIVVGGGPAGMMAAVCACMNHDDVVLIEKNATLGKKLLLTGNGRCNFTNACDINSFAEHFFHGGQFLRDAFKQCSNRDAIHFFEKNGIRCKTEDNNRVFPANNSAESILDVFRKELQRKNVTILYNTRIQGIAIHNGTVKGVISGDNKVLPCCCAILATGGISYPHTGSNGDGLQIASSLGHVIVPLLPGLVPLEVRQDYVRYLEGLTVKDVVLTFKAGKRKRISKKGDLLFTRYGISGPLTLSHSSTVVQWLSTLKNVHVTIDFFPGLTKEELIERMIKPWDRHSKKSIRSALNKMLPHRLTEALIMINGISHSKTVNHVTRAERRVIVDFLKEMRLDIAEAGSMEEAMITQGGVSLKEISPRTMESRIIKGLYFAGEILDVDADTGGFNVQAALSTGYCAGKNAALCARETERDTV